ncbi:MAG: sugar transferase [Planctomycetota bacterium]|jgi:exopolysaccharide biosynthesis polyprenyl glycosylphosphotransferase
MNHTNVPDDSQLRGMPRGAQGRAILAAVGIDCSVYFFTLILGYLICGLPEGKVLLFSESFDAFRRIYLVPLLACPVGFYFAGLYRRDPYRLLVRSAERAFIGTSVTTVLVLGFTYAVRGRLAGVHQPSSSLQGVEEIATRVWGIPFPILCLALVLTPIFLVGWRFLANRLEARLCGWSLTPRRLLVVGCLPEGDLLRLKQNHSPCYRIVGWLAGSESPTGAVEHPPLGSLIDCRRILEEHPVDEMLVVNGQLSRGEKLEALNLAATHGIRVWVVADVFDTVLSAVSPSLRGGTPVFRVREAGISGWLLVIKRLIDLLIAIPALLIVTPLLILPACLAIVIESKGLPIFAQIRVGVGGRPFRLYKLRTMVIDAASRGPVLTEDNDSRITRVGAFLRRTSIDELPQLWNVVTGSMSLIGPRAVVPYVADRFEEWERVSLNVKPGLTGLAQVSGRDEVGFREKSLLNIYYVRKYSLWLDLRIFFATILVVLSMEGTGGTRKHA